MHVQQLLEVAPLQRKIAMKAVIDAGREPRTECEARFTLLWNILCKVA